MKLDHVVYFTGKELNRIVEEQRSQGRHAVIGGRHEQWGTHNALLYVKNAYVEWLAIEHQAIAEEANHPLTNLLLHDLREGEGWGTICLSVDGIERFKEDIENKGFQTSGVLDANGERLMVSCANGKCYLSINPFQQNCRIHFSSNGRNRRKKGLRS